MARLIEGLWDCPYCDTTGIGGLTRVCPNCGKTRGEDTKFYMPGQKRYLSQEETEKVGTNPDWYCECCDSLNHSSDSFCQNCGSPKGMSKEDYFAMRNRVEKKHKDISESPSFDSSCSETPYHEEQHSYKPSFNCSLSEKRKRSPSSFLSNFSGFLRNYGGFIAGALAIVLIVAMLVGIFTPKIVTGEVEGFRWSRSVSIEEYKTVNESGWSLPSNGRLQYTRSEIQRYEQVLDHYETKTRTYTEQVFDHYDTYYTYSDNGNGTFTEHAHQTPVYRTETRTETYQEPIYRSEPVYATKYYYEIDKWVYKCDMTTGGNDHNPYWSDYVCANNERESGRKEFYYINVVTGDETEEYSIEYNVWQSLQVKDDVKLKVYFGGHAELYEETTPCD